MPNRAFIRFPNIRIPYYSQITECFARFTAHTTNSNTPVTLRIGFANDPNPSAPVDLTELDAVSVSDWVTWTIVDTWTQGEVYDSPDLSTLLQDRVENDDWDEGNALLLIIEDVSSDYKRGWSAVEYVEGGEKVQLFIHYYAREIDVSDPFDGDDGDSYNHKLWRAGGGNQGGGYDYCSEVIDDRFSIQGNRLRVEIPNDQNYTSYLTSKWFSGNPIDVSVDVDLSEVVVENPTDVSVRMILSYGSRYDIDDFCVSGMPDTPRFEVRRKGSSLPSEVGTYMKAYTPGSEYDDRVEEWTGGDSFTWRIIIRRGRVEFYIDGVLWHSGYMDTGGGEVLDPDHFVVQLLVLSSTTYGNNSSTKYVYFDNFLKIAGIVSWPSDEVTTTTTTTSSTTTSSSTTTTTTA